MSASPKKRIVIVHDPKEELFLGVLHPDAALFADYIDVREANREHRHFQHILSRCGLDVRSVRDILTEGTIDERGRPIAGKALEELKAFASRFLEYEQHDEIDAAEQERYKSDVLEKAHPLDLVNIILNRPKIILHTTTANTGFSAEYVMRPMMNLLFMRDSMISTPRGMILGRLHSPQRFGERLVSEFCLGKLGIEPIFGVPEGGYLEGGDYVLSGETSFIGFGMRTTRPTIEMLMDGDLFGTETVVIVKDRLHDQAQMHLDTYFNMIDADLGMLAANRFNARPGDDAFLTVDVYRWQDDGRYAQEIIDRPLLEYLASQGVEVIAISEEDSDSFGTNFLPVAPREIIAVSKKSAEYKTALREAGVKVHWVDLTHCTKGYGAAHCLSQIIREVK